ncbi:MAG: hypothetical protein JG777_1811, partial [Clostridia bacterium]|nr:hypothetical protein [Clostridia bacterium]MBZ4646322.1 hypothetical protein [Clostridia bacterium]
MKVAPRKAVKNTNKKGVDRL